MSKTEQVVRLGSLECAGKGRLCFGLSKPEEPSRMMSHRFTSSHDEMSDVQGSFNDFQALFEINHISTVQNDD